MGDVLIQVLLRLLPSLAVFALGFYASTDRATREQWVDLLYKAGSLRPDQKDDPSKQKSVRVPFFVVAAALLLWPLLFYMHSTKVVEVRQHDESTVRAAVQSATKATGAASGTPSANSTPLANGTPAANGTVAPTAVAEPVVPGGVARR